VITLVAGWLPALSAMAASPVDPNDELLRQRQRDKAQQERLESAPDVRLERPAERSQVARLPGHESPCFVIDRLTLKGDAAEHFAWALEKAADENDSPIGRCLGAEGINLVMKRVQNAIVGNGYITARILAEPQDLKSGTLQLTIIPGRVRAIRSPPGTDERFTHWNAFPMAAGDLLNLRDIEQALENLKRIPTVEADILIAPSEAPDARPGDSDLVVTWKQTFPYRVNLSIDDSGAKATGRYQAGLTLSGDHLLALNDLFYVTANQNLGRDDGAQGTRGNVAHYSLPFGYWLFGMTYSESRYHQSVPGLVHTDIYSGSSRNSDLRLARIVDRDASSKSTLALRAWQRTSHSYINNAEVFIQQRRMAGWELGTGQRRFLGAATLDGNLAWRQGTGAHGSLRAPEEDFGEGASHPRLVTVDTSLVRPFGWLDRKWRHQLAWRAQWNRTPLAPPDRFAIGGRYTVRGFDGENMLSADRGWLLRNDLGLALGSGTEAYFGLDHGRVGGQAASRLIGRELAGVVLGLRGNLDSLGYDLFVGRPFKKPDGFITARTTSGFMLNLSY
jgi:hemolysin activation/secretion protein